MTFFTVLSLPATFLSSAGAGWSRFFMDNFGIRIVPSLLGLGGLEVGHELVLVGLLDGGQPVRARPRHPLLVLLVVFVLL